MSLDVQLESGPHGRRDNRRGGGRLTCGGAAGTTTLVVTCGWAVTVVAVVGRVTWTTTNTTTAIVSAATIVDNTMTSLLFDPGVGNSIDRFVGGVAVRLEEVAGSTVLCREHLVKTSAT